ncbi:hypothetical protein Lal_00032748 [Lupinus albus]|nr:hypothetical protein Lal_00032748 [Lupinus albus]
MIKDLNDSKHHWKIAIRMVNIWYVQIPLKHGHLEMILMDFQGSKIQVYVRNEEFNVWKEQLVEYKTYVVHNFDVMLNDLQFKAYEHVYRMEFTTGTTLEQVFYPGIPHFEYDFKKFGQIIVDNVPTYLLKGKHPPNVSSSKIGSKLLIDEEISDIQKYRESFSSVILSSHSLTEVNKQLSTNSSPSHHIIGNFEANESMRFKIVR